SGGFAFDLREVSHGAARRARRHQRIGLERDGYFALALRVPAVGPSIHCGAATLELGSIDQELDAAGRDVDEDAVALLDQRDGPALGRLGRRVTDAEPGGAAAEAAVGDEGARRAEPFALEERRRVEHLLHAGPAAGTLVGDDDHAAGRREPTLLGRDGRGLAAEVVVVDGLAERAGVHGRRPAVNQAGPIELA